MSDLTLIVPARDEALALPTLLAEIDATMADHPGALEILVVDDGSGDHTPEVLHHLQSHHGNLMVLRHARVLGKSAALLGGARAARHPLLVTLDGDGQNDPADIPRLLAALTADTALVAGVRARRRNTVARRLASRGANTLRRWLLGDDCPDSACGLKLIRRSALLALPRFQGMHRFLPALCRQQGLAVRYLPVNDRPRRSGRSKYGLLDRTVVGAVDLLGVCWLRLRALPSDPRGQTRP